MSSDTKTTLTPDTHPSIKYKRVPVVDGPLNRVEKYRPKLVNGMVRDLTAEFGGSDLEMILSESLYLERARLRKFRPNIFTRSRKKDDQRLWSQVQSGLLQSSTEADRLELLKLISRHYSEEIAGHFKPWVYEFATRFLPWTFSWLLNAASVKRFLPWGQTESLQDRLIIGGEVPWAQKLSNKGTILLVPTHQSNIDSVLIGYVVYLMSLPPFCYGAGLNLFMNPVLSFFMSSLGAYTVDRQKRDRIYKAALKHYSTRVLREGTHSVFFPGGGRCRNGAIESHLKLGLLGTGLAAQIENYRNNRPKPNIYVFPMVTSYHFVLEASSLIEQYLADLGKHKFMGADTNEPPEFVKAINFFWRFFSSKTKITVRLGRPLDIFGNLVDEDGQSLGPNGTVIDPSKWLTTGGELQSEAQRDREYTKQLGRVIVDRYYKENVVLTSHVVAFSLFIALRRKYPELDLFRFLRISKRQRIVPKADFLKECERVFSQVRELANQGELFLSDDLQNRSLEDWVKDGMTHCGFLHESAVVTEVDGGVTTDDMNLLYYYRNRLSGYGLSLRGQSGRARRLRGVEDEQGFLA